MAAELLLVIFLVYFITLIKKLNRVSKIIFLFFISSFTLYNLFFSVCLLSNNLITVGSDSALYYNSGLLPFNMMINYISTNTGYAFLNWLFINNMPNSIHLYKLFLLKELNVIIYCISIYIFLFSFEEKYKEKSKYNTILFLSLFHPFVFITFTKNLRDSWILLGIAMISILLYKHEHMKKWYKILFLLIGILIIILFRPMILSLYIIAIIFGELYSLIKSKFILFEPYSILMYSFISFILFMGFVYSFYITKSMIGANLISKTFYQQELWGNTKFGLNYFEALSLNPFEAMDYSFNFLLISIPRMIFEPSPLNSVKIFFNINQVDYLLFDNVLNLLGAIINYIIYFPLIMIFLSNSFIKVKNTNKKDSFMTGIYNSFLLFPLYFLLIYGLSHGGAHFRTKLLIIIIMLIFSYKNSEYVEKRDLALLRKNKFIWWYTIFFLLFIMLYIY